MSSIMSQPRYTTPTGLRKLLTTDEDNIRSWLATDAFHEPYPSSWEDLAIAQTGSRRKTETPHPLIIRSKEDERCESLEVPSPFPQDSEEKTRDDTELHLPLPYELIEQIFLYLSAPALDAARFTCRSWWTMIMTTPAVLLSATGLEASSNIRRLAAAFDEKTNLSATYLHPDSWRVRYRINSVRMSLPQGKAENAHHPQRVLQAAAMTCKGNLFAVYSLVMTTDTSRRPGGTGMLTFYHFNARGPPVCVGSFSVPNKEGPMEVSNLAETESKGCWVFLVRMKDYSQPYALIARHGFGGSESPYIIKPMGPEHFGLHEIPIYRSLPQITAPQNRANDLVDTEGWRLLAWISLDKALDAPNIPHRHDYSLPWPERAQELSDRQAASLRVKKHLKGQQSCFIAGSIDTDDVCVVSGDRDAHHWRTPCDHSSEHILQAETPSRIRYQNRAVLLPPAADDTYTNVTVSDSIALNPAKEPIITIAVIWKSQHPPHTSTLYIYHLPLSVLTAPSEPSPPHRLQGKRLTSLPHPLYGGLHPKKPPLLSHKPAHLSGLSFSSPLTEHTATTWTASHPQLYIWGPPHHHHTDNPTTDLTVQIIDLTFSNTSSLMMSNNNRKINAAAARRRIDDDTCACILHDESWHITIPPASSKITASQIFEEERQPSEWVNGFWGGMIPKPRINNKSDIDGIGITQAISARRTAALERLENWKRVRVVGMKRAGLADGEVKEQWCDARWTHFGGVGRPRGWEGEWMGWEREMEGEWGLLGDAASEEYRTSVVGKGKGKPDFRFSISTRRSSSWIPRWLL